MPSDADRAQRATLRQLAIYDSVVRCRSAGRAARTLGLSQPAVSHAIGQLEQLFGASLLDRGSDGSVPNAIGLILHRRVMRLRDEIGSGLAAICDMRLDGDGVRQRLASLSSTQAAGHLAIAGHGSFRAAARRLAISEAAIQRTARELERMVGVPLYARRQQHIAVTAAGERLAASLQRGLAEIEQAHDEIAAAQGLSSGRIALACLPFMPKAMLAATMGQLLARYPDVEVSLEEGSYERLSAEIRRGRLDMLLGAIRDDVDAPDLETRSLFNDPYLIVARSDHPLASRPASANLADQSWVAPPLGTPRREALEAFFATLPRRPRIVLETASVAMTVETMMESDCLSLSCRSQVQIDFAAAHFAILELPFTADPRRVGFTVRAGWLPTPLQRSFITLLEGYASNLRGRSSPIPASEKSV